MPRYEMTEGTSKKFWEIACEGASFTTTYGRIGTAGQSTTKTLASAAEASREAEKLTAEKTRKGYQLVGGGKSAAASKPSAKAQPTSMSKSPGEQPSPTPAAAGAGVVPSAWTKRVQPRRGYPSAAAKLEPNRKAAEACRAHYEVLRERLLAGASIAGAEAALTKAVDARWRGGIGPSDVRVEAAAGAIARFRENHDGAQVGEAIADHWMAEQGLAFAVDTALASLGFGVGIGSTSWSDATAFILAPITSEANAKTFDAPALFRHANDAQPMLLRLRRWVARAKEPEYAAARDAALRHRTPEADAVVRVAATYLFPTERAWVEEDIASYAKNVSAIEPTSELRSWRNVHMRLLVTTITRFADFLAMNGLSSAEELTRGDLAKNALSLPVNPHSVISKTASDNLLATVLEGMGTEIVPLCRYWMKAWTAHRDLADALAAVPTDEAFQVLVEHGGEKDVKPALTAATAARAARSNGGGEKPTDAGDVPSVLVTPPWQANKDKKKNAPPPQPIVDLAPLPYEPSFEWVPGEKEKFETTEWDPSELEPGGYLEKMQKGNWLPAKHFSEWTEAEWRKANTDWEGKLRMIHGPEHLSLERFAEHANEPKWCYDLHAPIARHGLRVLPHVLTQAKNHPKDVISQLGPYDVSELAPIIASVLHVKKVKAAAEEWLVRHPRAAATGLVPHAVGRPGDAKKAAIAALQALAARGQDAVVREVAATYGREVATALDALLGEDPRLSKAPPKAPAFWSMAKLPPILLARGGALAGSAVENLRIMLALSEIDRPLPGLREALGACERRSLAMFGWALFDAWESAGSPNEEKWTLSALGFLGDDDTVRRLTPLIRRWPGESAHARAVLGLEVLGAIGTDLALVSIHGIAERLKFPALKELAQKLIAAIAKRKGLTVAELEDRLAPTLDLDDDGTRTLAFGGRTFTVGFDEMLAPFVRDASGARLASLPKPNAKDDAAKAKDATATFSALKKDVRTIAAIQLARLERAMIAGRRWKPEDFEAFFVHHPLLVHAARRLLWGAYEDGRVGTFRIAEDRTLATRDDEAMTVPPGRNVGIVHPMDLDEETLSAWGAIFADYELIQPFPQLGRGRYSPSDAERLLSSLRGTTVPIGKVLGLTSFGWARGAPQDSGFIGCMTRTTSAGEIRLELAQGFIAGDAGANPEQTLAEFTLVERALDAQALARLPPLEASELAYSVAGLSG